MTAAPQLDKPAGHPAAVGAAAQAGPIAATVDLDALQRALMDPAAPLDLRRDAAVALVDRPWPAALSLARRALLAGDETARRLIAQAVAESPHPPADLLDPLINALDHEDGLVRLDVAAALGRYDEPTLADQLIALAADPKHSVTSRLGAIAALACRRTQATAGALIKLGGDPDPSIQSAAFEALSQLTGRRDLGTDAEAWNAWWSSARRMKREAWLAMVLDQVARRNLETERQITALTQRLIASHQQAYETAGESERSAIVLKLMDDPMPELRDLALGLIERRVLNAQPVGPELRAALRAVAFGPRGSDLSGRRIDAARLLENLADGEAATLAVERLLGETDPAVQAAYLSLLARTPRGEAVEPAMTLIDQPASRSAAAALLVSAADAGILAPAQAERAVAAARRHLAGPAPPEPALIALVGRVGSDSDEAMLERHLDSGEASVKLAAAEAFVHGPRSIRPLLARADDPALRPALLKAVARKGATLQAAVTLLDRPIDPSDASAAVDQTAWQQALAAAAARLSIPDLHHLDELLARDDRRQDLRESVLRAAAGLNHPAPDPADERALQAGLLLARFYRQTSQPAKAKAVFERWQSTDLSRFAQPVRAGYLVQYVGVMVDFFPAADAESICRKALAEQWAAPAALAEPWLDSAERREQSGQLDGARTLLQHTLRLFDGKLDGELVKRLDALRTRLPAPAPNSN
jgi:hypothetical protein